MVTTVDGNAPCAVAWTTVIGVVTPLRVTVIVSPGAQLPPERVVVPLRVVMGGMNMGTGTGMDMPNRHLEVHVLDRRTMRPASNPTVSITYQALSPMMMRPVNVPVAVMVGLNMDMSDIHYGNNVFMHGGTYRVSVHVNMAYATYSVRL